MSEIAHSLKFFGCLLLLCVAANAATLHQETAPTRVAIGQRTVRELRGGEQHVYLLSFTGARYARVVVEQKGIDVVLGLSEDNGKRLLEVDNNLSGTRGMEVISLVTDAAGSYLFDVRSLEKQATVGQYEFWIEELRPPTDADRTRV